VRLSSVAEHPLAVLLDDLQWLDAATLDKAVEIKINFDASLLKVWAWERRIGEVEQA
jgi:hypothetical protein